MREEVFSLIFFGIYFIIGFIASAICFYYSKDKGERYIDGNELLTCVAGGIFMPIPVVVCFIMFFEYIDKHDKIKWIDDLEHKIRENLGKKRFFDERK